MTLERKHPRHTRPKPWGRSTRRGVITALKVALDWGVRNRLLDKNSIAAMDRPGAVRRERVLTEGECERILGWYPEGDPFYDLLIELMESGCRLGEVMAVTAADVDLDAGTWTVAGKTTWKTGKNRVIYPSPRQLELSRRLVAVRRSRPMFRNAHGEPWTIQAVECRFHRKKHRTRISAGRKTVNSLGCSTAGFPGKAAVLAPYR